MICIEFSIEKSIAVLYFYFKHICHQCYAFYTLHNSNTKIENYIIAKFQHTNSHCISSLYYHSFNNGILSSREFIREFVI